MPFRLSSKPTWPQLRAQVVGALGESFPDLAVAVAGEDEPPALTWHDGPAEGTVAVLVGEVPGWQIESGVLGPDPDAPSRPRTATLVLHRTFSDRALAAGVVRYQASNVRPYDPDRPGARERLWAILEEDDPADSGYPLVDAMATMLLDGVDLTGVDDRAALLAARLTELGYDRLWSKAWSTAEL